MFWQKYYDKYPLRERDLSSASLTRQKISSVIALSAFPIICALDLSGYVTDLSLPANMAVMIVFAICVLPFSLSRMSILPLRTFKSMDEWEREAKIRAEHFTYKVLTISLVAFFFIGLLWHSIAETNSLSINVDLAVYIPGNLLLLAVMLPAAYLVWTQTPLESADG